MAIFMNSSVHERFGAIIHLFFSLLRSTLTCCTRWRSHGESKEITFAAYKPPPRCASPSLMAQPRHVIRCRLERQCDGANFLSFNVSQRRESWIWDSEGRAARRPVPPVQRGGSRYLYSSLPGPISMEWNRDRKRDFGLAYAFISPPWSLLPILLKSRWKVWREEMNLGRGKWVYYNISVLFNYGEIFWLRYWTFRKLRLK